MSGINYVFPHHKLQHNPALKGQPIAYHGLFGLERGMATGLYTQDFIEIEQPDGRIALIPKERIEKT